jgi:signal transduction histidine kinase/HAMP domain-containing protein
VFNFITQRLQIKLILAFVLVLLIPTTIIGAYAIVRQTNNLIDLYQTDELALVQGQAKAVGLTVTRAKSALLYLAQSPDTQRYADSLVSGTGDITFKREFQEPMMAAFLRNSDKGVYKDVRILDKAGQEIVRVDDAGGTPTVIAENELENKGDRPYFTEAAKLSVGQVYASGLDLNVTKSQIDQPYVPVIRFSTPLFSKDGTFVGVMVIKAYAKAILADIFPDDAGENALLVDSQGAYWLHSDASKLYGALVNNSASVQSDLPNDSASLANQQDYVLIGSKDRPDLAQAFVHVKLPDEDSSRWTIIHQQPLSNVLDEVNQVRNATLIFAALSLLIGVVVALFITRGIVQPVSQLSSAAKQVSQGNLDAPVPTVKSRDEIGQLTAAFGTMTKDLKTSYNSLDRRAKELETVATVSASAASTLDLDKLLQTVSDLTKDNFGLYHAHVYLFDEASETLVLAAGAGTAGRTMKSQGRQIAMSNEGSLVARAARTRQGVIVNDVTKVADFLPNPLLPDTTSEMAIPMVVGKRLVGVLDVQSERVNRFTEADINVMTTLTAQIAVAVQNARAFAETEAARNQAIDVADINEALSKAQSELDVLVPLFSIAPTEGLSYATLSYVTTDQQNNPETLNIVAGLTPDGNPLDLSVFPSTTLYPKDFPLIAMMFAKSDSPLVINNIMTDPTADESVRAFAAQVQAIAFILLPLKTGDQWHGAMSVTYATPQNFSPDLAETLHRIMPTAGSVMAARRAYAQETVARRETEQRATELQTVAKVSATAATSLNKDDLLQNVSELVKSNFKLYHAHVYLLDQDSETLVLAAGAGEAGRIMKEQGRSISVNNEGSLVARAARLREGVIVNDVIHAPDFLANPLLPDTRAEMAVPMVVADRLVGVLDVQSDTVGRFTQADVQVLTTLSDQIAVAVQNAQLYEQQLETTEQLRTVDRLKSEFLASMSHELRTPLNSIIGYSRMLLDGADDELSEDTVEDLSAIHNGGKHLLSLINDILDLAKIEANKLELDSEPVQFASVVQEVSQMTSVLFKDKSLALKVEVPADMPDLWADRIRLRQILNNLVSNAVKFTESGSVRIVAGYDNQSHEAIISIIDTGIGIPPEKLALIFERFTQVDSSSARRAGGTGLGLTITKHLIDMHGGRIWVESEDGKGSTFAFSIPLVSEHETAGD